MCKSTCKLWFPGCGPCYVHSCCYDCDAPVIVVLEEAGLMRPLCRCHSSCCLTVLQVTAHCQCPWRCLSQSDHGLVKRSFKPTRDAWKTSHAGKNNLAWPNCSAHLQTCNYWVLAVWKCKASPLPPPPPPPHYTQAEWATAENEDTLLRTAWQPAASSFVAMETSYLWLCRESILKRSCTASCESTSLARLVVKTRDIMAGEWTYRLALVKYNCIGGWGICLAQLTRHGRNCGQVKVCAWPVKVHTRAYCPMATWWWSVIIYCPTLTIL